MLAGRAESALIFEFGWPLVARRRLTFLACTRKVSKRNAPCYPCPFAALRATCGARPQGGAAELATRLAALRSNSCGQSEHAADASCGASAHPALLGTGRRATKRLGSNPESFNLGSISSASVTKNQDTFQRWSQALTCIQSLKKFNYAFKIIAFGSCCFIDIAYRDCQVVNLIHHASLKEVL